MAIKKLVTWMNSNPILYEGKNFKLVYFGLFTSLGVFFSLASFTSYVNIYGFYPHYSIILWTTLILFSMLLFSKLFHIFVVGKEYFSDPIKHFRQTIFYNQGGQIGLLFSLIIMAYVENVNFLFLLDGLCYGGAIASFFGRIGCYNYGCCYGCLTNSTFSVSYYNKNSKILRLYPDFIGKKIFPIQLVSAIYDLLLYILMTLIIYLKLNFMVGIISLFFVCAYNAFRFLTRSFRTNENSNSLEGNPDNPVYVFFAFLLTLAGLFLAAFVLWHYSSAPKLHLQESFTISYLFRHTFLNLTNFLASLVPAVMVFIVHSYHRELGKHF